MGNIREHPGTFYLDGYNVSYLPQWVDKREPKKLGCHCEET